MFVKTSMVRKLFAAQFKLCFFPLWMLRCGCRWHFLLLFWVNYLSYTLSWCDCSHVWMRKCLAKHPLKEKHLIAYIAVICFFSSVWVRICMFRCPSHGNILPHTSLWYFFLLCGCNGVCLVVLFVEAYCRIHYNNMFLFSGMTRMVCSDLHPMYDVCLGHP